MTDKKNPCVVTDDPFTGGMRKLTCTCGWGLVIPSVASREHIERTAKAHIEGE